MTGQAEDLFDAYQRTGRLDLLSTAIELFRDAVAATPPEHPNRPACLSNLGLALQNRFGRTGHPVDLDEAITIGRDAVAATPADHPNRPMYLSNLGNALRGRVMHLSCPVEGQPSGRFWGAVATESVFMGHIAATWVIATDDFSWQSSQCTAPFGLLEGVSSV